jgi:membrane associated rhomboid family serine protease
MIPLKDNNPTSRFPFITILLIMINAAVFVYTDIMGFGTPQFVMHYATVPINITTLGGYMDQGSISALSTLITSQFLHGGFLHIAFNMLFLWIFGNNVEDWFGPFIFIIFYLLCGSVAALAQVVGDPSSQLPMVGASGAIAGVMGAYLLMFPRAEVLTLIWIVFFIRLVWLPAYFIIIYWIVIQLISQLFSGGQQGGVAYLAHIGGFAAGILLYLFIKMFTGKRTLSF